MKLVYATIAIFFLFLFSSLSSTAQVNKGDSLALVNLYNSTNGAQWLNNSGWLQGPVNSWIGIQLQNNRVVVIDLNNNNLTGTIPSAIKSLTALSYLNLGINHIGGSIPSSVGNLTSLTSLYLPENELTGIIPPSICKIQNLRELSLGNNHLTGKYLLHLAALETCFLLYLLLII